VALRIALLTGEVDASAVTPEDLLPYIRHMVDIDVPMFLRMLHSAGEHTSVDLLPQLDLPALVIAGDRDTFTPPRLAEEMAAALPHGELMLVNGGTHVVPLERKEMVSERVERFLVERVIGGASLGASPARTSDAAPPAHSAQRPSWPAPKKPSDPPRSP
jgi:pimeloyl-ACP methyl ester carboxylesterase